MEKAVETGHQSLASSPKSVICMTNASIKYHGELCEMSDGDVCLQNLFSMAKFLIQPGILDEQLVLMAQSDSNFSVVDIEGGALWSSLVAYKALPEH